MLKTLSLVGLLLMIAALVGLYLTGNLFSWQPVAIALQVLAIALMIWARMSFGRRSFHASADPTEGGLVTTGPYHYIRHPIYTAACLFCLGGIVAHPSLLSGGLGVLLFLGGLIRMLCEERMVKRIYPEYVEYAKTAKRMIPFVF